MDKVSCLLQVANVWRVRLRLDLHLQQTLTSRPRCTGGCRGGWAASVEQLRTFFDLRFMRMSSCICSVMGVYTAIQLFRRGVSLCCGTGICDHRARLVRGRLRARGT